MEQQIILLNYNERNFTNDKTGEVLDMLLVQYAIYLEDDIHGSKGWFPLDSYCKAVNKAIIEKYLAKSVKAKILITPNQNGLKYRLTALNGEELLK